MQKQVKLLSANRQNCNLACVRLCVTRPQLSLKKNLELNPVTALKTSPAFEDKQLCKGNFIDANVRRGSHGLGKIHPERNGI